MIYRAIPARQGFREFWVKIHDGNNIIPHCGIVKTIVVTPQPGDR